MNITIWREDDGLYTVEIVFSPVKTIVLTDCTYHEMIQWEAIKAIPEAMSNG